MRWANGRLRDEECPRDLLGRQASEQAERERHARLGRQHGMTGYEHEAQEVVADTIVDRGAQIGFGRILLADEGVLREILGKTDVAHDPRETGDQLADSILQTEAGRDYGFVDVFAICSLS